jgi:hypothetical protein
MKKRLLFVFVFGVTILTTGIHSASAADFFEHAEEFSYGFEEGLVLDSKSCSTEHTSQHCGPGLGIVISAVGCSVTCPGSAVCVPAYITSSCKPVNARCYCS